jgi:hypothetical protein
MFMIYLLTNYHIPSFNNSRVITIKSKAKENFPMANIFPFYIIQQEVLGRINRPISFIRHGPH